MKAINEEFSIVTLGYNFETTKSFNDKLLTLPLYREYGLSEAKFNIDIKNPLLEQQILMTLPVIRFNNKELQVIFNTANKALEIKTPTYSKENKNKIVKLAESLIKFRLSDISDLGLNFSGLYNNKEKRLSVLNTNINDRLSGWNKNIGFLLEIPLEYEDYLASYRVFKVEPNPEGYNETDHLYNISSNFNFVFDQDDLDERLKLLKKIFEDIDNYYKEFQKKCEEILSL